MLGWLPEQVSSFGGDIDSRIALIYYVIFAWFILLHGLLVYMLIRFRRREGRPALYLRGDRFRQLAWILLPTLLILALDIWIDARGERVWAAVKIDRPQADLQVRITGKQFNWEILYPGPDGQFGTKDDKLLENSLHVPVGKVVGILLESKDVLHSLFIPEMRLKQDAVPGRTIPVWFKAMKPGRYEIACAELCGFGHTTMSGFVTVHTAESWEEWVKDRWPQKQEAAPMADATEEGRETS